MKKNQPVSKRTLEELIAELPDDPTKVKPTKKQSVKDAIIGLRERIGSKVFTKLDLKKLVETAYPELAPVATANLDASLERAKEHVECVKQGSPNIYRFKQAK